MAQIEVYVDPDATGSGDGTSWTDAYTSLSAAEAAEQTDLVSAGDNIVFNCRASASSADTSNVVINGWTVSATNNIKILGVPVTSGYVDTSSTNYRLEVSGNHCIENNESWTEINGITIKQAGTGASDEGIRIALDGGTSTIKNCIIWTDAKNSDQDGIYIGGISGTINIENTFIYGFARAGIHSQIFLGSSETQTWNINSVGVWGNGQSGEFESGGFTVRSTSGHTTNINILNSWFMDNFDAGIFVGDLGGVSSDTGTSSPDGTVNWVVINSIVSDDSLTTKLTQSPVTTGSVEQKDLVEGTPAADEVGVIDITSSPYDLRLVNNANNLAQDYSATSTGAGMTIPSVDIVGTSRPQNTNYDVGSFEIIADENIIDESDTTTLDESLALKSKFIRTLTDTTDLSELLAFKSRLKRTLTDISTLSDDLTIIKISQNLISESDTTTLNDSLTNKSLFKRLLDDTTTISDDLNLLEVRAPRLINELDTTILFDNLCIIKVGDRIICEKDTATISESLANQSKLKRTFSDTSNLSDDLTIIRIIKRLILESDTSTLSDSLDIVVKKQSRLISEVDTTILSDNLTIIKAKDNLITELDTTALSDSLTIIRSKKTFIKVFSDTSTLSDNANVRIGILINILSKVFKLQLIPYNNKLILKNSVIKLKKGGEITLK